MRGFGMPEIHWGLEQIMDHLAEEVGMDPVEFRRINCVRTDDEIVSGMKMTPIDLEACIDKATEAIQWDKEEEPTGPNKKRGKGIAIMWKAPAMPPNPGSAAVVRFNEDATAAVLRLEDRRSDRAPLLWLPRSRLMCLGVPYENVSVASPLDTKYSPYEWQTVASRLTWSMGNAVKAAAEDARKQILETVADHWDEEVEDLTIKDGTGDLI